MSEKIRSKIFKFLKIDECPNLQKATIELNNVQELKKLFAWDDDALLDDQTIYDFGAIENLNERRIRDAESVGTVCKNVGKGTFLEIGTSTGHGTALMAKNAPDAQVHTINIPPEEANKGEGGKYITHALQNEEIGRYYRSLNLELLRKRRWIRSVCLGIEKLYTEGFLHGKIFHIKDSWVGIHRIE